MFFILNNFNVKLNTVTNCDLKQNFSVGCYRFKIIIKTNQLIHKDNKETAVILHVNIMLQYQIFKITHLLKILYKTYNNFYD